jgi:hypothetical protein
MEMMTTLRNDDGTYEMRTSGLVYLFFLLTDIYRTGHHC